MFDYFFFIHASGLILFYSAVPKDKAFIDKIITQILIEKRQAAQPLLSSTHKYYYKVVKELNLLAIAAFPKTIDVADVDNIVAGLCIAFIYNCEAAVRVCEIDYDAQHYYCFDELYKKNLSSLIRTGKLFYPDGGAIHEKVVRYDFEHELVDQDSTKASNAQDAQCYAPYATNYVAEPIIEAVKVQEVKQIDYVNATAESSPERKMELLKYQIREQQQAQRLRYLAATKQTYQAKYKSKSPYKAIYAAKDAAKDAAKEAANQDEDYYKYSKIEAEPEYVDHSAKLNELKSKTLAHQSKATESGVFGLFKAKYIDEKSIDEFAQKFKSQLLGYNVAAETVDGILENVRADLLNCYKSTFTLAKNVIQQTILQYIGKIIQTSPNLMLNQIVETRRQRESGKRLRPYTIAIIGINGMGKTTTIGKLLYKFSQAGFKTFVCACDSFRSGAVEYVKTHCDRLGAGCYDQGYGKSPSAIAKYGIYQAQSDNADVVLIDTAGRMHNNTGLMQELCKLISDNQPDLIVYVGEALVGSSGVVQIKEYSHQVQEMTGRGIDGVILTKYDTIGDKVGAALNFCYASGLPIYYVGVGYGYPDLAEVEIADIVSQLL